MLRFGAAAAIASAIACAAAPPGPAAPGSPTPPAALADAAASPAAKAPGPLGRVQQVLLSKRGRLAYVKGHESSVVFDTVTGKTTRFVGDAEGGAVLDPEMTCEATITGIPPTITLHFLATDPTETRFAWSAGDEKPTTSTIEDVANDRRALVRGHGVELHHGFATYAYELDQSQRQGVVPYSTMAPKPLTRALDVADVVTTVDESPRSLVIDTIPRTDRGALLVIEDPLGGDAWEFPVRSAELSPRIWASIDRSLVVVVSEETDDRGHVAAELVAFDLKTRKERARFPFASSATAWFRLLVAPAGDRVALSTRTLPADLRLQEYEEANPKHACQLHVAELDGTPPRTVRVPCLITLETPLRFEGDTLVTDGATRHGCDRPKLRTYDVKSLALRSQKPGPEVARDVDDATYKRAVKTKTERDENMIIAKREAWSEAYNHPILSWSVGTHVLAQRGDEIVSCAKRGGACLPPLARAGEEIEVAVTVAGDRFAFATDGVLRIFESTTGKKIFEAKLPQ